MERHAMKISFSTNIYMAFGATTINFVTVACSFHLYKFSKLFLAIFVSIPVFQTSFSTRWNSHLYIFGLYERWLLWLFHLLKKLSTKIMESIQSGAFELLIF